MGFEINENMKKNLKFKPVSKNWDVIELFYHDYLLYWGVGKIKLFTNANNFSKVKCRRAVLFFLNIMNK